VKIRFETTIDDVVALNHYHATHSPTSVRALRIWQGMPLILGLFVTTALALLIGSPESAIGGGITSIVLGGAWVLVAPYVYHARVARTVRSALSESTNNGTIGPHELELTGGGLVHRNSYVESRVNYSTLEPVVTDGYTFIYMNALAAHVIPHAAVTESDPDEFVAALRQKIAGTPSDAG
jgi:hypothetical protein